jgi:hypothetical protein
MQVHFMVPGFKLKPLTLRNMPQCFLNYKLQITNYHIRIKKFTSGSGILNSVRIHQIQENYKIKICSRDADPDPKYCTPKFLTHSFFYSRNVLFK